MNVVFLKQPTWTTPGLPFDGKTNKRQNKKYIMKIKNRFLCAISAMTQSKWLQPAVLTLVVGIVLFVGTGCRKHH